VLIRKDGSPRRSATGGRLGPAEVAGGMQVSPTILHSGLVARRRYIDAAGGYKPLLVMTDWDLFLAMSEAGCRFSRVKDWTIRIRLHDVHLGQALASAEHIRARLYVYPKAFRLRGTEVDADVMTAYCGAVSGERQRRDWWSASVIALDAAARNGASREAGRMALSRHRVGSVPWNADGRPLPRWWLLWALLRPALAFGVIRWAFQNWPAYWWRNRRECLYVKEAIIR